MRRSAAQVDTSNDGCPAIIIASMQFSIKVHTHAACAVEPFPQEGPRSERVGLA